jgi:uncharacterized protein with HEPN domain
MRLEDRDLAYLIDMLSCCNDVVEFTSQVTFESFANDRMRRLATERQLETLGEAANHVSETTQQELPSIAWSKIVGLRNKLAHDYGEVLAERVWQIAKRSIPDLKVQLLSIPEVKAHSGP